MSPPTTSPMTTAIPNAKQLVSEWPPICTSSITNCTCCCILTPHTHLSDAKGYPHLNHIIRFPQATNPTNEVLAWLHCPHCPCGLELTWVHPKEMQSVEESMSTATWLPRLADFEYTNIGLFEETPLTPKSPDIGPSTPMEDVEKGVLGERSSTVENVPEPQTPVVQRKTKKGDGTRKSARKTRSPKRLEKESESFEITYRPRKSKYDIQ